MIQNCGSLFVQWRPCHVRTVCLASLSTAGIKTEQLRQQLDILHKEAESTRAKANNVRLRLLRLSEAAEKLRRQASISVQTGKENDARELLFQKKKVMQAMEKSKGRIEVLDEFAMKLNEAISIKEGQLIGNVALDLEVGGEDGPSPIRIVSSKEENTSMSNENLDLEADPPKYVQNQDPLVVSASQGELYAEKIENNHGESINRNVQNEVNNEQNVKEMTSYEDFMCHLDQQLNKMQMELQTFLRFSALILESEEKPENCKVHHAMEILEGIRHVRERIANIAQTKVSFE
ncbi:Hypothetical predicted protein [Olea europaea subsp. europaea]|uniref:Uncharacterized protein n=1 Tax=Olea europaea subsp. europaea TaxID=158383 RepID=A0A8S0UHT4_OLEEU|nr:Hypothetical predicted protein [Olea europaea subsp. europaea]